MMFKCAKDVTFILASASPRRRELLAALGLEFSVQPADCDERRLTDEAPKQMVERLALVKAQTLTAANPEAWVLGADTCVVIDGHILGKPENEDQAVAMLQKIQGREHTVWGGLSLANRNRGVSHVESHSTQVKMSALSDAAIRLYIASGEPMDKAGAYAIQGIGAGLVESVEGSYTNVVGLNLAATLTALRHYGVLAGSHGA